MASFCALLRRPPVLVIIGASQHTEKKAWISVRKRTLVCRQSPCGLQSLQDSIHWSAEEIRTQWCTQPYFGLMSHSSFSRKPRIFHRNSDSFSIEIDEWDQNVAKGTGVRGALVLDIISWLQPRTTNGAELTLQWHLHWPIVKSGSISVFSYLSTPFVYQQPKKIQLLLNCQVQKIMNWICLHKNQKDELVAEPPSQDEKGIHLAAIQLSTPLFEKNCQHE